MLFLLGEDHKARGVVVLVLDVLGEHLEAIDLGGKLRCERAARDVARLGDMPGRPRRVGGDHRLVGMLANEAAALAKCVDMAFHRLDRLQGRAFRRHQIEMDPQEVLADDVQVRVRQ